MEINLWCQALLCIDKFGKRITDNCWLFHVFAFNQKSGWVADGSSPFPCVGLHAVFLKTLLFQRSPFPKVNYRYLKFTRTSHFFTTGNTWHCFAYICSHFSSHPSIDLGLCIYLEPCWCYKKQVLFVYTPTFRERQLFVFCRGRSGYYVCGQLTIVYSVIWREKQQPVDFIGTSTAHNVFCYASPPTAIRWSRTSS